MDLSFEMILWSGAVLVYMGWLNKEIRWKFYRYKKSLLYVGSCIIWLIIIIFLISSLQTDSYLLISGINFIMCGIVTWMLSEEKRKSRLFYSATIGLAGVLSGAVFSELGGVFRYLPTGEAVQKIYWMALGICFVVGQKILLEQWSTYRIKQQEKETKLIEAMSLQDNIRFQEKQYSDMAEVYDELKKIRHDMHNSYMIIDGLLEQGKIAEAREYLNLESEQLDKVSLIIQTESVVISTLLNRMLHKAQKKEVEVSCKIITSFQGIAERDLCHVLGNLLDNALEAAIHVGNKDRRRFIDIVIRGDDHRMLIEVENSSDKQVLNDINKIRTSKKDENNHGFGLKNIKAIVEEYAGNMEIGNDSGNVKVSLLLFRKEV